MAGRVKNRLSRKLESFHVVVDPDDLETTEHACRDVGGASWGGYGHVGDRRVWVYSFFSMTECLQHKDLAVIVGADAVEVI